MAQCGGHCGEAYALVCMCSACGTALHLTALAVLQCFIVRPVPHYCMPFKHRGGQGQGPSFRFPFHNSLCVRPRQPANTSLPQASRSSDARAACRSRRLRKQVEYWKEQAGLITADAKVAADLYDIDNRRCDSPAPSEGAAGFAGYGTPPSALPAGLASTSSSRPGTGLSRTVGSAIALQLQAAAADASAPMVEPETDAATELESIAGESVAPPSSRSLSGSESEP